MILILIPVAVLTMRAFSMNNSGWSYWINKEYLSAMDEYKKKAEQEVKSAGAAFSLEDKKLFTDMTRLQSAAKVVMETERINNQVFDSMVAKTEQLKTKYAGSAPITAELQEAYDGLRKDFEDLKVLETGRQYYKMALLDFAITNQGKIFMTGKNLTFNMETLGTEFNSLQKAALDNEKSFGDRQRRLMDRHNQHLSVFTGELGKLQKSEYSQ